LLTPTVAQFVGVVIAGLDPAMHQNGMALLQSKMDAQVTLREEGASRLLG
jgi:hypothetical protein